MTATLKSEVSVGIVMRTKDRNVFLKRAIESVLDQSYRNWFLVIINDGGDQVSVVSVVNHFANRFSGRIKLFHNSVSIGMEASSNVGLEYLQTEMAVIHDDDDSWAPEFLSRMLTVYNIEKINNNSIKGIICHCHRVHEVVKGNLIYISKVKEFNQDLIIGILPFREIYFPERFPSISFIFNLNICREIGLFDSSLAILGDWDFTVRFMMHYNIWVLPQSLAFHHHREDLSGNFANKMSICSDEGPSHQIFLENKWFRDESKSGKIGLGIIKVMCQTLKA